PPYCTAMGGAVARPSGSFVPVRRLSRHHLRLQFVLPKLQGLFASRHHANSRRRAADFLTTMPREAARKRCFCRSWPCAHRRGGFRLESLARTFRQRVRIPRRKLIRCPVSV